MTPKCRIAVGALALLLLHRGPLPAAAQDFWADVELGGGVLVSPSWEGSSQYELSALPLFRLNALQIRGLLDIGGAESGWTFGPSMRFVNARDESDQGALVGLGDVDRAYEFGGKIGYRWEHVRALAELRQGFGGHEGVVGALGVDLLMQPLQRLQLEAGPRLIFASEDYMQTYFGVDGAQSVRSGLPVHATSGGLKGVGVDAKARLELTPVWALIGQASYERLVGDAANSPVVTVGSADQFTAGLGLSYRLKWGFDR